MTVFGETKKTSWNKQNQLVEEAGSTILTYTAVIIGAQRIVTFDNDLQPITSDYIQFWVHVISS